MNKKSLFQLLSIPTAPYREQLVIGWVKKELVKHRIPFFQDELGNLVLGVATPQEYRLVLSQKTTEPLRIFIAHMDHPGFHGVRWNQSRELEVRWFGGSPRNALVGAKVWLASEKGWSGEARIKKATLHPKGTHLKTAVLRLDKDECDLEATQLFGGFSFRAPVWENSGIFYTKAADDLVGCFAVLETAKKVCNQSSKKFIGLLTRAEEVGFVGCVAHVEKGSWKEAKRPLLVVSLETSRTLPGALVGKGPVVRLGDRASLFTPSAVEVLTQVAQKKLKGRFQRRIMDGGTCEATVAVAHQIPAVGISIPLGNYHNQGFEGGPDCKKKDGPAPEFVSYKDVQGMLKLCEGLLEEGLPWEDPWENKRRQLAGYLTEGRKYL